VIVLRVLDPSLFMVGIIHVGLVKLCDIDLVAEPINGFLIVFVPSDPYPYCVWNHIVGQGLAP
jgi:hypothetical protein